MPRLRVALSLLSLLLPLVAPSQLVRQANTTLALPADLPSATGYTTVNALGSLTFVNPMCVAFPPGETNRLYVLERGADANLGRIQVVNNLSTTPVQTTFMDLETYLAGTATPLQSAASDETGMLSMVFHPNYRENGYFYLYFTVIASGQRHQRLARFQATGTPGNYLAATSANPATMMPMLTMRDEASNHNGGDLHFGTDGHLYLSLGDEGGANDQYNNSRFISKDFWGQLLRLAVADLIDGVEVFAPGTLAPNAHTQPNSTAFSSAIHPGSYKVPGDNPFLGTTSWHGQTIAATAVRTEIFATGFRNPFRFSIDAPTGRIFLGDVGQNLWEEIDLVQKGGDYGWSWREGGHPFTSGPSPQAPPASGFSPVEPIYEYDHANNGSGNDAVIFGTSVTGGIVYRGNQLTELTGAYLFADVYGGNGIIAALRETSPGVWTGQRLTTRAQIVDFGTDPRNGEPLLCSLLGTIWRLTRSGTTGPPPPALLSQTGAFSNLANLTPHPGIVRYAPNVEFWSDHAIKSRWFAIKNTTDQIEFARDGAWSFPTGMVWVKHFDIPTDRADPLSPRRRLETRFLVKTAADIYGLSYKWRIDQTDADLVAEEGVNEEIPGIAPSQTWRYPSRSECRQCHTAVGGFALSFNTRQLNREAIFGAQPLNQIAALRDARSSGGATASYFTAGSAPVATHPLPFFSPATDAAQSLEHRVRSYLAVNCVQCHQPGGAAQGHWDARAQVPTVAANLIDGLLINDLGDEANRFAAPGDTAHSMVLQRVRGLTAPRMPPVATNQRDLAAEQLLTDWITQELPTRQTFDQWQRTHFGSTTIADAQSAADPDGDGNDNATEFLQRTAPRTPEPPLAPAAALENGELVLQFSHPANRSCLVETATDLQNWTLWDVPGNAPIYPRVDTIRTLSGPAPAANQFFRLRQSEP